MSHTFVQSGKENDGIGVDTTYRVTPRRKVSAPPMRDLHPNSTRTSPSTRYIIAPPAPDSASRGRRTMLSPLIHTSPGAESREVKQLRSRVRTLENEVVNQNEEAKAFRDEYLRIQTEGRRLYVVYESKCNRLQELKNRHEEQCVQLCQKKKGIQQLKGEINEEHNRTEEWKQKYKEQGARFKQNFESFRVLREDYRVLNSQLKDLNASEDRLSFDGGDSESDVLKELASARQQIRDLEKEVVSQSEKLEKYAKSSVSISSALSIGSSPQKLAQRMETLSISNDLLREERKKLEQEASSMRKNVDLLTVELEKKGIEIQKAEESASAALMKEESYKNETSKQIDIANSLRKECENMKENMESLKMVAQDESRTLGQLREEKESSQKELQASHQRRECLESEILQLQEELKIAGGYMEANVQLETQLEDKGRRMSIISEENSVAEAKIKEYCQKISELENQISCIAVANENVESDMRLMYKKHQDELTELRQEYDVDAYQKRYADIVHRNKVLEEQLEALHGFVDEVEAIDARHESTSRTLQESFALVLAERQQLEKERNNNVDQHALREMLKGKEIEISMLQEKELETSATILANGNEISSLKEEVVSSSKVVEDIRGNMTSLEEEKQFLDDEVAVLRDQISDVEGERQRLRDTCDDLEIRCCVQRILSNVVAENETQDISPVEEHPDFNTIIAEKDAVIDNLKIEVERTQLEKSEVSEFVEAEKAVLEKQVKDMELALQQNCKELDDLEKRKMEDQIAVQENLEAQKVEYEGKISALEENLTELKEEIATKTKAYTELEATLQQAVEQYEQEKEGIQKKFHELDRQRKKETTKMRMEVERQYTEASSLRLEIHELKTTLDAKKKENEEICEQVTEMRFNSQSEISVLQGQKEQLVEEKLVLEKKVEAVENSKAQLEAKIESLGIDMENRRKEHESDKQFISENEKIMKGLNKKVENLENSLSVLQAKYNAAHNSLLTKKREVRAMENRLEDVSGARDVLAAALEKERSRRDEISKKLLDGQNVLARVEEEMRETNVHLTLVENEKNQLALQLEMILDGNVEESPSQVMELERMISSLKVREEAERTEKERLSQQIIETKATLAENERRSFEAELQFQEQSQQVVALSARLESMQKLLDAMDESVASSLQGQKV